MSEVPAKPVTITPELLSQLSIAFLARVVKRDWKRVYFGAVPYLDAMFSLESVDDSFGLDNGRSIVSYFLANAQTYRGPVAKMVKAELKTRLKAPRARAAS
jgi:hypothetical protein